MISRWQLPRAPCLRSRITLGSRRYAGPSMAAGGAEAGASALGSGVEALVRSLHANDTKAVCYVTGGASQVRRERRTGPGPAGAPRRSGQRPLARRHPLLLQTSAHASAPLWSFKPCPLPPRRSRGCWACLAPPVRCWRWRCPTAGTASWGCWDRCGRLSASS